MAAASTEVRAASRTLTYRIGTHSGWSGPYHPSHILHHRPNDQNSRWSVTAGNRKPSARAAAAAAAGSPSGGGGGSDEPAFLILHLSTPAVVTRATFGKYMRPHPCNLSDFKLYALPLASPAAVAADAAPPTRRAPWVRILRDGLRNDPQSETFPVRWTDAAGIPFATEYLMLVPLATHQPNYHCTVWHFSVEGTDDPGIVQRVLADWEAHTNDMALRLTAKHLRLQGHLTAFAALLRSACLGAPHPHPFEHPIVERLFSSLVLQGDFDAAEAALERAAYGDPPPTPPAPQSNVLPQQPPPPTLFELAANKGMPRTTWTETSAHDPERMYRPPWPAVPPEAPTGRAGQAAALDPTEQVMYMHGGYDGQRDLADFWRYDLATHDWHLLTANTAQAPGLQAVPGVGMQQVVDLRQSPRQTSGGRPLNGPSARSGHAMAFDSRSGMLYLLGRRVDEAKEAEQRALSHILHAADTLSSPDSWERTGNFLYHLHDAIEAGEGRAASAAMPMTDYRSDMWGYNTRTGHWTRLSADVDADGGPPLVYEHQIVVDSEAQRLYVFGGNTPCTDLDRPGRAPFTSHSPKSDGIWLGLWEYDLVAREWRRHSKSGLLARAGHALLLSPRAPLGSMFPPGGQLWIVGGARGALVCDDVWTYDLRKGTAHRVATLPDPLLGPEGKPAIGATPTAALDMAQSKLIVLTGQAPPRAAQGYTGRAQNELWVLDLASRVWTRVWKATRATAGTASEGTTLADELATTLPGGAVRVNESGAGPGTSFSAPSTGRRHTPRSSSRSQSIFSAFRTGTTSRAAGEDEADLPDAVAGGGSGGQSAGRDDDADDDEIDFGLGPLPSCGLSGEPWDRARATAAPRASMPARFRQSMVYVPRPDGGELVVFGGQSTLGRGCERRGDTWHLKLAHVPVPEMLRRARFQVRQQKFLELLHGQGYGETDQQAATRSALAYLQSSVADVVDYASQSDTSIFRDLSAQLLAPPPLRPPPSSPAPGAARGESEEEELLSASQVLPGSAPPRSPGTDAGLGAGVPGVVPLRDREAFRARIRLFEALLAFLPPDATEPTADLGLAVSRLALKDRC